MTQKLIFFARIVGHRLPICVGIGTNQSRRLTKEDIASYRSDALHELASEGHKDDVRSCRYIGSVEYRILED